METGTARTAFISQLQSKVTFYATVNFKYYRSSRLLFRLKNTSKPILMRESITKKQLGATSRKKNKARKRVEDRLVT
jgi:hypothetical protein